MQEHDNQILVPPSFIAAHSDARERLLVTADALRARYELCEDLASALVEQAQKLYETQASAEAEVLRRIHGSLSTPAAGLASGEATWITTRLAELLAWSCPALALSAEPPPSGKY